MNNYFNDRRYLDASVADVEHMPFHEEGIGWWGSRFYSLTSQSRLVDDLYESVTKEICSEVSKGKILDIGTGPGLLPIRIAQMNPELEAHGVDISGPMIEVAERNAIRAGISQKLKFKVGSVYSLPYKSEFFDMVVSTQASITGRSQLEV